MKNILFLLISSVFFIGCNNAPIVSQQPISSNSGKQNSQTAIAHTTENSAPATNSEGKTKWTQSGTPIDTATFDAEIEKAQNSLKGKPNDDSAKKSLSQAFTKRGVALTNARQYAAALGDYRRAIKYDPQNEEAKNWIQEIIGIYESINRDYPKEGEEPPPLPFKKDGDKTS